MDKRSKLLFSDFLLIPGFIAVAISGLNLHVVHKTFNGNIWGLSFHNWMIAHITIAFLFLAVGCLHIYQHWGWFRQLIKSAKNKSKITIIMSVIFLSVALTGIISLMSGHSHVGLLHAKLGEFMIIFGIVHFISRFKLLVNLFKKKAPIKEARQAL